ncbi:GNAT family N-acetyltransferase [Streptomyces sp. CS057]|uniref:GNAT family N-acetyltransferase n=1 Tax=Streptomyces sp. CS057 TaxID=1982764 RepID=UPI000B409249|nr:GNAT family N-acetyltransferase [Streptomyces sp. CS057]OWA20967.1 GNAT family N-acetyltransferase [Streptomyces sp. CS057]
MIADRLDLPTPWAARPLSGTVEEGRRLSRWMGQEYLVETWDQAWPPERWSEELRRLRESREGGPFLITYEGRHFAYVEVYRPLYSNIAAFQPWSRHDLGFHLAIVDRALTGRGLGTAFVADLVRTLFRCSPGAERVAAEPDVRNLACRRVMERAGMSWVRTVRLPHKEAALHVCPRSRVRPAPERPGVAAPLGERPGVAAPLDERPEARHPAV